jgi:hypothetical protein
MELNMTHVMFLNECRTFGAHLPLLFIPGLTAGPIVCRPFGPAVRTKHGVLMSQKQIGIAGMPE